MNFIYLLNKRIVVAAIGGAVFIILFILLVNHKVCKEPETKDTKHADSGNIISIENFEKDQIENL